VTGCGVQELVNSLQLPTTTQRLLVGHPAMVPQPKRTRGIIRDEVLANEYFDTVLEARAPL